VDGFNTSLGKACPVKGKAVLIESMVMGRWVDLGCQHCQTTMKRIREREMDHAGRRFVFFQFEGVEPQNNNELNMCTTKKDWTKE
jgi:hypothetical protein